MYLTTILMALSCDPISGTFEATDAACLESPVLLCIDGDFSGGLEASYHGVFQTLELEPTLTEPLRLAYSSFDTFTTDAGVVDAETSGHIVLNDTLGALVCLLGCNGDAACLGGCLLTYGGTSFTSTTVFEGAQGWLAADGTGGLDFVSRGSYEGEICG
jgi:hypothetical protein